MSTPTKKMKANTKGVVSRCQIAIPLPVSTTNSKRPAAGLPIKSGKALTNLIAFRKIQQKIKHDLLPGSKRGVNTFFVQNMYSF